MTVPRLQYDKGGAADMAAKFGVSKRTAYRHLAAGTVPDDHRSRGLDGKTYPGSLAAQEARRGKRAKTTPSNPDLLMARNAVRRLLRLDALPFTDVPFLEELRRDAAELASHFRSEPE